MPATNAVARSEIVELPANPIETPRPLQRLQTPAQPFPVDALGSILGGAARAIEDSTKAPMAMAAQSVLAVGGLSVQQHCDVMLPTDELKPTSIFAVTVGVSGERKTSVDRLALAPVRDHEGTRRDQHEREVADHQNRADAFDAARRAALASNKGDEVAIRADLDKLGLVPTAPLDPYLIASEPTIEGFIKHLARAWPSCGVFSAEAGAFVGGHGFKDENRLKTAAGLSSLWDGEPVRRLRAAEGETKNLNGRRVSMHLMLQPGASANLLSDPIIGDQGLRSRLLVVAPETRIGSRFWSERSESTHRALEAYRSRIRDLLSAAPITEPGRTQELCPTPIGLTGEARATWIKFSDHVEVLMRSDGEYQAIRGFAAKMAEHAARIGAILARISDDQAREISGENLAAGIELAQHYATEALRLHEAGITDPDIALAQRLLDWLHAAWQGPNIGLRHVYQRGPNSLREKKPALRIVGILEDHGHLARIEGGAVVAGEHCRDAWRVVR